MTGTDVVGTGALPDETRPGEVLDSAHSRRAARRVGLQPAPQRAPELPQPWPGPTAAPGVAPGAVPDVPPDLAPGAVPDAPPDLAPASAPSSAGTSPTRTRPHRRARQTRLDLLRLRATQLWASLDAPLLDRRVPGTLAVAALAGVVGLVVAALVVPTGFSLAYADAQSHLTIARRVIDSRSPGFEQLGTVWLPVPHLLLLPFVRSLWLWHTGWAAALLGSACLAGTAAATYRVAARIGLRRAGRLTTVAVLLANPSVLYLHTTALTEPVLMLGLAGAFAGLARWVTARRTPSGGELAVFAGLPTAVAVLSRYEGWALVAGGVVLVVTVRLRRGAGIKVALVSAFAFAAVPVAGICWWLAYNWALYGNPLEFMFGQYSAAAQQKQISDTGLLTTKGNAGMTLWSYNWSLYQTAGVVVLVLALVGAVALARRGGWSDVNLLVGVTSVSYVFSILSLYLGQTAIVNDHTLPAGLWNNRFALSVMIPLAVLAGVAVHHGTRQARWARAVVLVVAVAIVAQNAWWAQDLGTRSAVIAEGRESQRATAEAHAAYVWLGAHYDGGGILVDETAGGNAMAPTAGIPLAEYVNRSAGTLFTDALTAPATHARWVIVNAADLATARAATPAQLAARPPQDKVAVSIATVPGFDARYRLVLANPMNLVYERIGP